MDITQAARSFLAHRRLALVGVSRDSRDFSRVVFAELARRGYDVVPVNPIGGEGRGGMPFVRRVQDIDPPLEAALLMTPPAVTTEVVKDCVEAGIHHVWMHQGVGRGAASPAALALCRAQRFGACYGRKAQGVTSSTARGRPRPARHQRCARCTNPASGRNMSGHTPDTTERPCARHSARAAGLAAPRPTP